jgi:hypothetical protein
MSTHDRNGRSAQDWEEQQNARAEKNEAEFNKYLKERQGRTKPENLNDTLSEIRDNFNEFSKYLDAKVAGLHTETGTPHHRDYQHDAVTSADHTGDLLLPAALATAVLLQEVTKMVKAVADVIEPPHGITREEMGAGLAKVWDQLKESTEQIVEDVKQQITELVAPEKDEQEKHEQEAPDPQEEALRQKQADELAKQAVIMKEQEKKFADSPEHLAALQEVAKATEIRHAAELQKLQQQRQAQEQQQLADPNRNR